MAAEALDYRFLAKSRSRRAIHSQAHAQETPIYADGRLSVRETATRFRVHRYLLGLWIDRGLLPAVRVGFRSVRIEEADAQRLIPKLKRASAANRGRPGWWDGWSDDGDS